MTIDYDDIIHADLGTLQDASKAWKKMGDRYGTLHSHYSDYVKAAVDADTWRGYSVLKFNDQAQTTLEEYADARDEARAVSGQLDEAYTILKACKDFVIEERDAALEFGMDVDSRGKCTINLARRRSGSGRFVGRSARGSRPGVTGVSSLRVRGGWRGRGEECACGQRGQVGGACHGALTALAQSGRPGDPRAERAESYERHGFPRVQGRLEERARAVGVPHSDIQDLASPCTDLRSIAESAYPQADRAVDGQGTEGEAHESAGHRLVRLRGRGVVGGRRCRGRVVAGGDAAEAEGRERALARADFDKGEDSQGGLRVARSVGTVTGALTSWAQSGRPDGSRVVRIDYY